MTAPPGGLDREQIVAAAVEVLRNDGVDALSLRRVARELDVTPMALYRYVDDIDDLVVAILDHGFSVFRDRLRDLGPPAEVDDLDPIDAVVLTAAAFWDFAVDHGTYFELMFLTRRLPGGIDDRTAVDDVAAESFGVLVERVRHAASTGRLASEDPTETAGELLAVAVGTVALHRTGNLGWSDERAREHFLHRIRHLLSQITTGAAR